MATVYSDWCSEWLPNGASIKRKFRIWVTYTLNNATGTSSSSATFTNISYGIELNASNGGTFASDAKLTIGSRSVTRSSSLSTTYSSSNPTLKYTFGTMSTVTVTRTTSTQSIPIKVTGVSYSSEGTHTQSLSKSATVNALYTITYNINDGTGTTQTQKKSSEANITLKGAIFSKTNYTLLGWSTSSGSGNSVNYNLGATYSVNGTKTLYAVWKANYEKPTISSATAVRTNSGGTAIEDGTYVKFTFNYVRGHVTGSSPSATTNWSITKSGGTSPIANGTKGNSDASSGTITSANSTDNGSYSTSTSYSFVIKIWETYGGEEFSSSVTVVLGASVYPIIVDGLSNITFGIPVKIPSSKSSSWLNQRSLAAIRVITPPTEGNQYYPAIDIKSYTGDWAIGPYQHATYGNGLYLNYVSNTNFNSLTNSSKKFVFQDDGNLRIYDGAVIFADHSSSLGTTVYVENTSAKTLSSSTWTEILNFQLDKGVWILIINVRWSANASGFRKCNVATTSKNSGAQYCCAPASGEVTNIKYPLLLKPTSTTTYYLNMYQNSGSELTCPAETGWVYAIRIR